eukprot:5667912-Prymnesium_polylepis.1
MPTRISLRRVGGNTAKKAALPATMAELLELATKKLELQSPASRVFAADGGEYDADDLELIEKDDVLWVSCGEDFVVPTALGQPADTCTPVEPPP